MSSRRSKVGMFVTSLGGCLTVVLISVILAVCFGGSCLHYDLNTLFGTNPPQWECVLGAIFVWPVLFPATFVIWLIVQGGVHTPFWHLAMMAPIFMSRVSL